MFPTAAAMSQNVGIGAAGIFQGIGQDRQAVEGAVGVYGLGETGDGAREPGGVKGDGPERVAEDTPQ